MNSTATPVLAQQALHNYETFFLEKNSISSKKVILRKSTEALVNDLVSYSNSSNLSYSEKIKKLIRDDKLDEYYKPALNFIWHEGSGDSHPNKSLSLQSEDDHIVSMAICTLSFFEEYFRIKNINISEKEYREKTKAFIISYYNKHSEISESPKEETFYKKNIMDWILLLISFLLGALIMFSLFELNSKVRTNEFQELKDDNQTVKPVKKSIDSLNKTEPKVKVDMSDNLSTPVSNDTDLGGFPINDIKATKRSIIKIDSNYNEGKNSVKADDHSEITIGKSINKK